MATDDPRGAVQMALGLLERALHRGREVEEVVRDLEEKSRTNHFADLIEAAMRARR